MKSKLTILFLCSCFMYYGQTRFNRVRQYINGENPKILLSFLDSCLFKDYHRDSSLLFKGLVNLRLNQTVEAIRYFKLLEEEYPEFWQSHYLHGLIYFIQKRYHESIIELNIVLKNNPQDWRAYYDRALSYGQIDAAVAAIEDLNACLLIYPKFASAYYTRAYWYENIGEYEKAIKDYEINLQMEPKNFEAYLGIAYAYQKLNKLDMACESINRAIKEGSQAAKEVKSNICK